MVFNIEIYVEPLSNEKEKNPELETDIEKINSIKTVSKTLEYIKISGEPILSLKETNDKAPDSDEDNK
jgi:hypothetical protein